MTSHAPRLYALALAIVVFFLAWATVSARPWANEPAPQTAAPTTSASPSELAALRARERALRKQIALAKELLGSEAVPSPPPPAQVASAPAQVVNTPPATVTQSS